MAHDVVLHPEFIADLRYWIDADRKIALRLMDIVESTRRTPFEGIGKPERLRYVDGGAWSRRLTHVHRVVYYVHDDRVEFVQARHHYR